MVAPSNWLTSLDATREVLEDPVSLLRGGFGHPRPKIPGAVHFGKGEKMSVCEELVRRGICEWIESSTVAKVDGIPILNGLFGVQKPSKASGSKLEDGRPILRVIMNLKPTNSVLTQIRGAVDGLPAITAWQAALLESDEGFHCY